MDESNTDSAVLTREDAAHGSGAEIVRIFKNIAQEINSPIQYIGDNARFLQGAFDDVVELMEKFHALLAAIRSGSVTKELITEVEETQEGADWDYLSEEIPNALEQTVDGIGKVSAAIRGIRDFCQPTSDEKVSMDLNEVVESSVMMTKNDWKAFAELTTDLESDMPPVTCLRAGVNQVIVHLIENAAEALEAKLGKKPEEKGMMKISTRSDRNWAEFCISDTGCGIPEEIRPRIFESGFTTKDEGKHKGQGLALCKSVVEEKHGGTMRFESVPGTGTIFIIRLPYKTD